MSVYKSFDVEQYFPTYDFLTEENRDIALLEYETANKILENEERFYTNSTNIAILAITFLGSVSLGFADLDISGISELITKFEYLFLFSFFNFLTALIYVSYFGQKQKELCFAARKVITLRRLLGISYGKMNMILPTWRVEGADNPLSIKSFRPWTDYIHFPVYLISICSTFLTFLLFEKNTSVVYSIILGVLYFFTLMYAYRRSAYDFHENLILLIAKLVSQFLSLELVSNFEYITYRSKLQTLEMYRMKVEPMKYTEILLFLEDRTFFKHGAISYLSILRASFYRIVKNKRSGASTITQQLVRTLYISDHVPRYRRKILEIVLSCWAFRQFKRQDIITMYIGAVRFERNVFGIMAAMKHFLSDIVEDPSKAQMFFLLERVSNINSRFLGGKIYVNIRDAYYQGILIGSDVRELINIYQAQIEEGKIKDNSGLPLEKVKKMLIKDCCLF